MFDKFWHGWLGRPYRLAPVVDEGAGLPVVLLHGIGRSAEVWQHVVELLVPLGFRAVAFDLLGFGASPKPRRLLYDADDHAAAVINSILKLGLGGPVVLVGHSMGCLVAVRVARLRPDLVRHLVLYEMPLLEGLPEKRRYRLRLDLYRRFYEWVIGYQPTFGSESIKRTERLARRIVGFEVTPESWQPFVRSLENTIMKQTTAEDIKALDVPMDVIYGSFDMLVIRGRAEQVFGDAVEQVKSHTIRARHEISPKASRFIVDRIESMVG